MTIFNYNQSNFSVGELTPLMRSRTDNEIYYKSLKFARNIITFPQGGFRRRFGLDYVDQIEGVTSFSEIKFEYFNYDENSQYLIVIVPYSIIIYKNDNFITTITTNYSAEEVALIRVDQQLNLMVLAQKNHAPKQLTRGVDDYSWAYTDYVFKNLPVFDFLNNYDDINFTLGSATGTNVLLTASSDIFTSENVGGTFEAVPGLAKIIQYIDPKNVRVDIIAGFSSTSLTGYQSILTEPAFSATRGWPAAVSFYQQRLVFANTNSLPNAIFFSAINNFQNFLVTFGQSTDALLFLVAGTKNEISYLVNAVSLFAFTDGGAYATPPLTESAFTASTARINRITSNGIKKNVQPIFADNQIFFLDKSGVNLIGLEYNITTSGYKETPAGFTAKTLIRSPIDIDKLEFDPLTQGNYIFLCNEDGTLVIFETVKEEKIQSWTLHDTENGEFGRVANVNDDIYFAVKRRINDQDVFYIEKKNNLTVLDCASNITLSAPSNVITGLEHLENEIISVKADGVYIGDNYQVDNGSIILEDSYTNFEVGYNYIPRATLLPISIDSQYGPSLYLQRSIKTVIIDMFETAGIQLNGEDLNNYLLGTYEIGNKPPLFSGNVIIPFGQSLSQNQEVTITQNLPYNMSIIGIGQQFTIGG